jgi:hypothetical protein
MDGYYKYSFNTLLSLYHPTMTSQSCVNDRRPFNSKKSVDIAGAVDIHP